MAHASSNKAKGSAVIRWGMKRLKRFHLYNAFFAGSLLMLIALASWWAVFIKHSITFQHEYRKDEVIRSAELVAMRLGHRSQEPQVGLWQADTRLEIRPHTPDNPIDGWSLPLRPFWNGYVVSVTQAEQQALADKFRRQQLMWYGEGSFFFLLLGISVLMLYRLMIAEVRAVREANRSMDLVTHELKTPLAGIRALLQSLSLGRVPEQSLTQVVGLGINEIDRLEHLVENLLVRNRLQSSTYVKHMEPIKLREAVSRILDHRQSLYASKQSEILEDGAEWLVEADGEGLRVVLENLLDNARKYGDAQSPTRVELRDAGAMVDLCVHDQGWGIAPETLQDIFEPYFRETRTDRRVRHGSGLGLSIAREMARRMGGDLKAQSHGPGKGSTFLFSLKKVVG